MLSFRFMLLFAALLGLAGQATATTAVQAAAPAAEVTVSDDCMEMMADREDSKPNPCDGSFKCMAAMGCLSLNMIAEFSAPRHGEQVRSTEEYWPAVTILRGATFAPEPDPPTTFA